MHDNPPTPRRRYFRFGLRKMFVALTVVAIFFGWLGWQAKIVRDRKVQLAALPSDRLGFAAIPGDVVLDVEEPKIPIVRQWLGDQAVAMISAPADYSDADMKRICQLFPEAIYITRYNEQSKEWDNFHIADAATRDGTNEARRRLWFLMWPAIAFAAFFAWLLFRMIRRPPNTNPDVA